MHVQIINLPRTVPMQRMRPPQPNIPQTKVERDRIGAIVRGYVQRYRLVPPMPIDELREHAERETHQSAGEYRDREHQPRLRGCQRERLVDERRHRAVQHPDKAREREVDERRAQRRCVTRS